MTLMSWFVLVNQKHDARPVYSETQINDSNESIHFGEPKTYCSYSGFVIYGSLYRFSESA